ncbi:MAG: hypothetical protein HRT47_00345 [Candidatus Caenarcaniphilales bacterium]|nr:hypothetical protein [Candidatus Caenarcaniphilales bacterium]
MLIRRFFDLLNNEKKIDNPIPTKSEKGNTDQESNNQVIVSKNTGNEVLESSSQNISSALVLLIDQNPQLFSNLNKISEDLNQDLENFSKNFSERGSVSFTPESMQIVKDFMIKNTVDIKEKEFWAMLQIKDLENESVNSIYKEAKDFINYLISNKQELRGVIRTIDDIDDVEILEATSPKLREVLEVSVRTYPMPDLINLLSLINASNLKNDEPNFYNKAMPAIINKVANRFTEQLSREKPYNLNGEIKKQFTNFTRAMIEAIANSDDNSRKRYANSEMENPGIFTRVDEEGFIVQDFAQGMRPETFFVDFMIPFLNNKELGDTGTHGEGAFSLYGLLQKAGDSLELKTSAANETLIYKAEKFSDDGEIFVSLEKVDEQNQVSPSLSGTGIKVKSSLFKDPKFRNEQIEYLKKTCKYVHHSPIYLVYQSESSKQDETIKINDYEDRVNLNSFPTITNKDFSTNLICSKENNFDSRQSIKDKDPEISILQNFYMLNEVNSQNRINLFDEFAFNFSSNSSTGENRDEIDIDKNSILEIMTVIDSYLEDSTVLDANKIKFANSMSLLLEQKIDKYIAGVTKGDILDLIAKASNKESSLFGEWQKKLINYGEKEQIQISKFLSETLKKHMDFTDLNVVPNNQEFKSLSRDANTVFLDPKLIRELNGDSFNPFRQEQIFEPIKSINLKDYKGIYLANFNHQGQGSSISDDAINYGSFAFETEFKDPVGNQAKYLVINKEIYQANNFNALVSAESLNNPSDNHRLINKIKEDEEVLEKEFVSDSQLKSKLGESHKKDLFNLACFDLCLDVIAANNCDSEIFHYFDDVEITNSTLIYGDLLNFMGLDKDFQKIEEIHTAFEKLLDDNQSRGSFLNCLNKFLNDEITSDKLTNQICDLLDQHRVVGCPHQKKLLSEAEKSVIQKVFSSIDLEQKERLKNSRNFFQSFLYSLNQPNKNQKAIHLSLKELVKSFEALPLTDSVKSFRDLFNNNEAYLERFYSDDTSKRNENLEFIANHGFDRAKYDLKNYYYLFEQVSDEFEDDICEYIGLWKEVTDKYPNLNEVTELFYIPLEKLLDYFKDSIEINESSLETVKLVNEKKELFLKTFDLLNQFSVLAKENLVSDSRIFKSLVGGSFIEEIVYSDKWQDFIPEIKGNNTELIKLFLNKIKEPISDLPYSDSEAEFCLRSLALDNFIAETLFSKIEYVPDFPKSYSPKNLPSFCKQNQSFVLDIFHRMEIMDISEEQKKQCYIDLFRVFTNKGDAVVDDQYKFRIDNLLNVYEKYFSRLSDQNYRSIQNELADSLDMVLGEQYNLNDINKNKISPQAYSVIDYIVNGGEFLETLDNPNKMIRDHDLSSKNVSSFSITDLMSALKVAGENNFIKIDSWINNLDQNPNSIKDLTEALSVNAADNKNEQKEMVKNVVFSASTNDPSEGVRELAQNSIDAIKSLLNKTIISGDKLKSLKKIIIKNFIDPTLSKKNQNSKEVQITSVKDSVGMTPEDLFQYLFRIKRSTKEGITEFIGENGQGFYLNLKDKVYGKTAKEGSNSVIYWTMTPLDESGKYCINKKLIRDVDIQISIIPRLELLDDENDFSGTIIESQTQSNFPPLDVKIAKNNLEKSIRLVDRDLVDIELDSKKINNIGKENKLDFTTIGNEIKIIPEIENTIYQAGLLVKDFDELEMKDLLKDIPEFKRIGFEAYAREIPKENESLLKSRADLSPENREKVMSQIKELIPIYSDISFLEKLRTGSPDFDWKLLPYDTFDFDRVKQTSFLKNNLKDYDVPIHDLNSLKDWYLEYYKDQGLAPDHQRDFMKFMVNVPMFKVNNTHISLKNLISQFVLSSEDLNLENIPDSIVNKLEEAKNNDINTESHMKKRLELINQKRCVDELDLKSDSSQILPATGVDNLGNIKNELELLDSDFNIDDIARFLKFTKEIYKQVNIDENLDPIIINSFKDTKFCVEWNLKPFNATASFFKNMVTWNLECSGEYIKSFGSILGKIQEAFNNSGENLSDFKKNKEQILKLLSLDELNDLIEILKTTLHEGVHHKENIFESTHDEKFNRMYKILSLQLTEKKVPILETLIDIAVSPRL